MKREAVIRRETAETKVELELTLAGTGESVLHTGLPFFEHMLSLISYHASWDLKIKAEGDIEVEPHHLVEDVGLCLGKALKKALGKKEGIKRYGSCLLPMDEALVMVALDLSGRPYLGYRLNPPPGRIGDFDVELVEEFLLGLVNEGRFTLHIRKLAGHNRHHLVEALCKGLGRALKEAVQQDGSNNKIPSTKGVL